MKRCTASGHWLSDKLVLELSQGLACLLTGGAQAHTGNEGEESSEQAQERVSIDSLRGKTVRDAAQELGVSVNELLDALPVQFNAESVVQEDRYLRRIVQRKAVPGPPPRQTSAPQNRTRRTRVGRCPNIDRLRANLFEQIEKPSYKERPSIGRYVANLEVVITTCPETCPLSFRIPLYANSLRRLKGEDSR